MNMLKLGMGWVCRNGYYAYFHNSGSIEGPSGVAVSEAPGGSALRRSLTFRVYAITPLRTFL